MKAVSNCKRQTPWLTKLTIGCFETPQWSISHIEVLIKTGRISELCNKYQRVQSIERQWFPDVFDFDLERLEKGIPPEKLQPTTDQKNLFLDVISHCWNEFTKVQGVCYLSSRNIMPARYRLAEQHFANTNQNDMGENRLSDWYGHTGLTVCFHAFGHRWDRSPRPWSSSATPDAQFF
ncbi:hypothetical protein BU25DRAFT_218855 [Macroventuria anomochaeta]|uniref:Uncharacterized protein n=1 Tax=Macroventuria anomochaeta TaxID=301207 RepID=A0ACB6RMD0_9PLEO|nr:uncharacterized protein BU25DRAFT_218855 [Macroventuria anomochaeta]KAF2622089.1 hypothetical protein BU25DRAFT_218855 [Macroventuria anomochaeta]